MLRISLIILALMLGAVSGVVGTMMASASGPGLTSDMILTALQSAHVATAPGSRMDLIDRREGAQGWHVWRLDRFSVRTAGGHFVIEGDATRL